MANKKFSLANEIEKEVFIILQVISIVFLFYIIFNVRLTGFSIANFNVDTISKTNLYIGLFLTIAFVFFFLAVLAIKLKRIFKPQIHK